MRDYIFCNEIGDFIVTPEASLALILQTLERNKCGVVSVVTDAGFLVGTITDGDVRRALINATTGFEEICAGEIANKTCRMIRIPGNSPRVELPIDAPVVSDDLIPVVTFQGRLVGVLLKRVPETRISYTSIGPNNSCYVIGEIGNNHNGSVELAKELIDGVASAGANAVKFQLRDMKSCYKAVIGNPKQDLAVEYTLDLLNKFQFSESQIADCFQHAEARGILPLCTPWDIESAKFLGELGVQAFKIASADMTNFDLIEVCASYGKPLIISTGMSSQYELELLIEMIHRNSLDVILLHCNSAYPAHPNELNLGFIDKLAQLSNCVVGYSSHERGIHLCTAAVALGASVIEKHVTLDQTMEGSDHKISVTPTDLKKMIGQIRDVENAKASPAYRVMSQGEMINRHNLGKSLYYKRQLASGAILGEEDLMVSSPGDGIPPSRKNKFLGKKLARSVLTAELLNPKDFEENPSETEVSKFEFGQHSWGIPVRFHDIKKLSSFFNWDFVEFHLSYKDLSSAKEEISKISDLYVGEFTVHAPELFRNDQLMDLSGRHSKRNLLAKEFLEQTIEMVLHLRNVFSTQRENPTKLILNVGGFSETGFLDASLKEDLYLNVSACLKANAHPEVEFCIQNMPPFPWHFGGQRFHNLFVDPTEYKGFFENNKNIGLCFDTSHALLACHYLGQDFEEHWRLAEPFLRHLHIADASSLSDEGIQLGEGNLNLEFLVSSLVRLERGVSFIPEVWQGHKNDGEQFNFAMQQMNHQWLKQLIQE